MAASKFDWQFGAPYPASPNAQPSGSLPVGGVRTSEATIGGRFRS